MKQVVILISGRGSNLQALLSAGLPCKFAAVISNRADAEGLRIAEHHGIPVQVIAHREYPDRAAFDRALATEIDRYQPDFVVLAGFMRILTDDFVNHYAGRLINIHPSLLPAFTGINTHERALQEGVKIHGCTVHFVTPALDHGPIIIQAAVPVLQRDTPRQLAERVLQAEHVIYPRALRWLCDGVVALDSNGKVACNLNELEAEALISPGLE
jgi:phosphoribosylglycinamide formyltransferase 1